jgi:hypothetical protein
MMAVVPGRRVLGTRKDTALWGNAERPKSDVRWVAEITGTGVPLTEMRWAPVPSSQVVARFTTDPGTKRARPVGGVKPKQAATVKVPVASGRCVGSGGEPHGGSPTVRG